MGLNVSHNCWDGAYSSFNDWREILAKIAGFPPLDLMEGFFDGEAITDNQPSSATLANILKACPISWEYFKQDPLTVLLDHSDCDGEIAWEHCGKLMLRLRAIAHVAPECLEFSRGNFRWVTLRFADGLRDAYEKQENVLFR